ncbi:MAG: hypothetical protein WA708_02175 [Acidobacteriaceae bacterium]
MSNSLYRPAEAVDRKHSFTALFVHESVAKVPKRGWKDRDSGVGTNYDGVFLGATL